jgi:hypothetical protein
MWRRHLAKHSQAMLGRSLTLPRGCLLHPRGHPRNPRGHNTPVFEPRRSDRLRRSDLRQNSSALFPCRRRRDRLTLELLIVIGSGLSLALRGHREFVFENLALRQQLTAETDDHPPSPPDGGPSRPHGHSALPGASCRRAGERLSRPRGRQESARLRIAPDLYLPLTGDLQ